MPVMTEKDREQDKAIGELQKDVSTLLKRFGIHHAEPKKEKPAAPSPIPGWLWFAAGVVIGGAVIEFGVH